MLQFHADTLYLELASDPLSELSPTTLPTTAGAWCKSRPPVCVPVLQGSHTHLLVVENFLEQVTELFCSAVSYEARSGTGAPVLTHTTTVTQTLDSPPGREHSLSKACRRKGRVTARPRSMHVPAQREVQEFMGLG